MNEETSVRELIASFKGDGVYFLLGGLERALETKGTFTVDELRHLVAAARPIGLAY